MISTGIENLKFSQTERPKYIQQLLDTHWDIIVVGGGIAGAGVALEAVTRGLSVAIFDQRDFAFGTSSRSTKLAHGGIRYIAKRELGLVREATTERNWLREKGLPHLTRPTRFLWPVLKAGKVDDRELPKTRSAITMRLAAFLYDLLCGFNNYATGKSIKDINHLKELEPLLNSSRLKGAVYWYDNNIDDARLVIETLKEAIWQGKAIALNYMRIIGFTHDADQRVCGVQVIDETTPQKSPLEVRGKVVVNTTGAWADRILSLGRTHQKEIIRPTKGVHLAYHRQDFPINETFATQSIDDGRVIFAIRRNDWILVGTTDTDYTGDPVDCYCSREDADYLRNTMKILFPKAQIGDDKILGTYAGLRPLVADQGKAESDVSRKHVILERDDGLFSLLGGKLTTFRKMAEDLFRNHITHVRKTARLPKFSTKKKLTKTSYTITLTHEEWQEQPEVMRSSLHPRILHHLYEQYGRGGLTILHEIEKNTHLAQRLLTDPAYPVEVAPWIIGEIDYVVHHEAPLHLEDVLCRRLEICWLVRPEYQGHIAAITASRMRHLLDWSTTQMKQEIATYLEHIRKNSFFFKGKIPIPDLGN